MTALEIFKKCRRTDSHISALVEQQERLRSLAERTTASYSDVPRGGTAYRSKLEDTAIKIVELEREINRKIDRLVDLKAVACHLLEALTDDRERDVLTLRYLNGYTWGEVARHVYYGRTQVWRLHRSAIDHIQSALDDLREGKDGTLRNTLKHLNVL